MAIDFHTLKSVQLPAVRHTYGADDCILYALGVGAGLADRATFGDETAYVFEEQLRALPAMVSVLGYPGFWMREPQYGIDWTKVVHGEQRVRLLAPIPTCGTVLGHSRVINITDKGASRGALIVVERRLTEGDSGKLLAVIEQTNFCRGDGGYSGGNPALSDAPPAPVVSPPDRPADARVELPTGRNLAAIYRLCGDRNPLHVDPEAARNAGFAQPILHGLILAGLSCRAVISVLPDRDERQLSGFDIRFSAPVYPGETMITELWHGPGLLHFRCKSKERDVTAAFGQFRLQTPSVGGMHDQ
jgi:acyl dehydratase